MLFSWFYLQDRYNTASAFILRRGVRIKMLEQYVGWVLVLVREYGTGWRLYLRLAQNTRRTDRCTCWRFKSFGILCLLVWYPRRLEYSSSQLWELQISWSLFGVDHVRVSQLFFLDAIFLFKILNFHCVFSAIYSDISYLLYSNGMCSIFNYSKCIIWRRLKCWCYLVGKGQEELRFCGKSQKLFLYTIPLHVYHSGSGIPHTLIISIRGPSIMDRGRDSLGASLMQW